VQRALFGVQGVSIEVAPAQTLLQAALAAGLPYPHNCRVGSCATCRCRLVEGKVDALTDSSYVLSRRERETGTILACQTRLLSDITVEIEWPARSPTQPVSGSIAAVRPLTAGIVELALELDRPMRYIAGQYARISVPSIDVTRSYSFASAPDIEPQSRLEFHVRRASQGVFTSWLSPARVGEPVEVGAPKGTCILSRSSAPLLFIAGGSGLAPIKAILEQANRDGCARDAVFLFGARTEGDLYALPEIESIASRWAGRFEFLPVLSREPESSDWRGRRGRVTDGLASWVSDLPDRETYVCGSPMLVASAMNVLSAAGVADASIHADSFSQND